MSPATIYKKLVLNGVTFNGLSNKVNPHFQCPTCRYTWQPELTVGATAQTTFDFNQKSTFSIPQHLNPKTNIQCLDSNQTIELYVAVHHDTKGTKLIIQRSDAEGAVGVASNWWVNPQ